MAYISYHNQVKYNGLITPFGNLNKIFSLPCFAVRVRVATVSEKCPNRQTESKDVEHHEIICIFSAMRCAFLQIPPGLM
jgi:hypothetical protein